MDEFILDRYIQRFIEKLNTTHNFSIKTQTKKDYYISDKDDVLMINKKDGDIFYRSGYKEPFNKTNYNIYSDDLINLDNIYNLLFSGSYSYWSNMKDAYILNDDYDYDQRKTREKYIKYSKNYKF